MLPRFTGYNRALAKKKIDEAIKLLNQAESIASNEKASALSKAESYILDGNWQVRNIGVKILGRIGEERHVETLSKLLRDANQVGFVRRNAARGIREIGISAVIAKDALVIGVDDGYWEVRVESIKTLGTLFHDDLEMAKIIMRRYLGENYMQNLDTGNETRDIKSKERNFEVREAIAGALGNFSGHDIVFRALRVLLCDENWIVRAAALSSISKTQDNNGDSLKKIFREIDLTCESFRPVFPLKELFASVLKGKKGREN